VVFLAFVHLALFLALSLSPGNSLVSSQCDLASLHSNATVDTGIREFFTADRVLWTVLDNDGVVTNITPVQRFITGRIMIRAKITALHRS